MKQGVTYAAAAAFVGGLVLAGPDEARSGTTVFGGGDAEACSDAAQATVKAEPTPAKRIGSRPDVIRFCDRAIAEEPLGRRDLAATFVNRGVLRMGGQDTYPGAQADFDAALKLKPDLAEAHANRGAVLIGLGHYQDGIAEIGRSLEMGTDYPEKAYYNRALAEELLDDPKGAYFDYLKASELKPDWPAPQEQLKRFTVSRK